MPKRSSKDENVTAFEILQAATGQESKKAEKKKNPAAVELGRLGGLKGGPARAKKLSEKKRKEIALNAARSRWAKK